MPEDNPNLQSHYAQQVAADLERNLAEQERIRSEAAALQGRLEGLQKDHGLLVSMQAAVGAPSAKNAKSARSAKEGRSAKEAKSASVPRARRRTNANTAGAENAKPDKAARAKTPAKAVKTAPSLRELVVALLAAHQEPRSAAEVAQELAQSHPERKAGVAVVRNALEASVAKNQSERTKQQKSVYYSAVHKSGAAAEQPRKTEPSTTDA